MVLPRSGLLNHRHFVLLLSFSALALLPFLFIHLHRGNVPLLAVAGFGMVLLLGLCLWVMYRRTVVLPGLVLLCGAAVAILAGLWTQGTAGAFWAYTLVPVAYLLFALRPAIIFNVVFFVLLVAVAIHAMPVEMYLRHLVTFTIVSVLTCMFANAVWRGFSDLDRIAQIDPLTGVWNRRHLHARMAEPANWLARDGVPCSLVVIDLDGFKGINDQFGHGRGDEIICRISQLMNERMRVSDLLFRYGGDEFVMMLPNTSESNAVHLTQELRRIVASMEYDGLRVTISAGVAELQVGESVDTWIGRADAALLEAKRSGRNRVATVAGGTEAPAGNGANVRGA